MVAAHDERGLLDVLQIREAFARLRAPLPDGGNLCWCDFVVDRRVAVLSARQVPLQEGSAGRLTFLRISKEDFDPQVLGWVIRSTKGFSRLRGDVTHAICCVVIPRGGTDPDHIR